ncbi:macrophage mannose receptor 1 [Penaeus vannamei]|uniref:macrophage mannose receptor 1 n=1 Tax=Penaeus vannamei TaxID=6689 RepID=UPI00387F8F5E
MLRLSLLLANAVSANGVCLDGWTLLEATCFLVSNSSGNWFEGQDFCYRFGASLAVVSSAYQQGALSGMLDGDTWIGLHGLNFDHTYSWGDGSPFIFSSWAEGKPTVSGSFWSLGKIEACVEMRQEFQYLWNNAHCGDVKLFMCSRPAPAPTCEGGWQLHESSCYRVSEITASWTEAKDSCIGLGGVLASITSEDEQAFVSGLLNSSAWIGLSDQETEGEFTWEDGSPFNYDSWEEGEPDNLYMYLSIGVGEDCVEMKQEYDYRWNDEFCLAAKGFVCERPE